jgi:uncharacterized protein (TIGR02145 family)
MSNQRTTLFNQQKHHKTLKHMKAIILVFSLLLISTFGLNAQTVMNIYQNDGTVLQIPLNNIDSITYTITNPGNLATISTTPISSIGETYAVSGGTIINDGGTIITQRGVCYSTSPSPTTASATIISGSGIGVFSSNLNGLTPNTTYYVRAYAINSAGTSYGDELSFTTLAGGGGIVSTPGSGVTFDGYTYSSIVLGNGQEWMAENLRSTHYSNGDSLISNWWHYNNDAQFDFPFGKLYNWFTTTDPRNVCPIGWHVPTTLEWDVLINYLGGSASAGGILKDTIIWDLPNVGATNLIGFNGLPSGYRYTNFNHMGQHSGFWTSSEDGTNAYARDIHFDSQTVTNGYNQKSDGLSIRCLKD